MEQRFLKWVIGQRASAIPVLCLEAHMLTQDENIIDIRLAAQYQIKDAKDYLFNVDRTKR